MPKYYAGIGSRKTPTQTLILMERIADKLGNIGYVLRSGGALGADHAFECGATASSNHIGPEIFLADHATSKAIEMASQFHPAWDKCTDYVRRLHGRNAMILLGKNLDSPVNFVICWTPDGKDSGGTGLGIRIAKHHNIRITNLYFNREVHKAEQWLLE